MRKIVVGLILCLCLSSVAMAFVPLVIPAAALAPAAAIAVTGAAAGLYYYLNPVASSTTTGSVSYLDKLKRSSLVSYAVMIGEVLTIKTDSVDALISESYLRSKAEDFVGGQKVRPELYDAVFDPDLEEFTAEGMSTLPSTLGAGDNIRTVAGGAWYAITGIVSSQQGGCDYTRPSPYVSGNFMTIYTNGSHNCGTDGAQPTIKQHSFCKFVIPSFGFVI